MKKSLLALLFLCFIGSGFAQDSETPTFIKNFYFLKMSPNGKWLGSMAGGAKIYNAETGDFYDYSDCYLGLGNPVANNGWAVGNDATDRARLMVNGRAVTPESLRPYWFCDLNAITPDATRVVGIINNTKRNGVMYVPFYCDLDADGNMSEPVILPYPETDFFRAAPQFVTAVWISEDGHTVIGEVLDWRGMYEYPIIYKEDENGEWTYSCPTKSYFNTEDIEIPDNPWLNEPEYPEITNFMSPEALEVFMQEQANAEQGLGDYPDPFMFMSEEEEAAYRAAVEAYNDWFYSQQKRINEYIQIYLKVLNCSVIFSLNELTLSPSGDYLIIKGETIDKDDADVLHGQFYGISTIDNTVEEEALPNEALYPSQILSDGTVIAASPMMMLPVSYIKLPDSKEFIRIEDYFATTAPAIALWMEETIPFGSGLVSVSDDMTVFSGGLLPDHLAYYDDNADFFYSSYIIKLGSSGVENVEVVPASDSYSVYNIQGVKVLETTEKGHIEGLPSGLYIINGKKVIIK